MTCPRHTDAGAYLLAALPASERASFQAHLYGCTECRRAVGELADLPGLLARVPESTVVDDAARPLRRPPPTLLTGLLSEVTRRRNSRRLRTVCAAVLIVLAFVGVAVVASDDDGADPGAPTRTVAMTPVAPGDVLRASLDLTPRAWGTEIRLHCSYYGNQGAPVYVLAGRTGSVERELARWSAPSAREVRLSAASDLRDFDSFEIRTAAGRVLLRSGS